MNSVIIAAVSLCIERRNFTPKDDAYMIDNKNISHIQEKLVCTVEVVLIKSVLL